jgi:curved DNA-binding protein CbpA
VEDYYAILGLDPEASPESIKVAYRRLAREHHPDRKIDSTEYEKRGFSAHMAQLNAAYAVLSDVKLRREYDQNVKILTSLHTGAASRTAETVTKTVSKSDSGTRSSSKSGSKSGERAAPRDDVDSTLAQEFSKQLRTNLLAHDKGFTWEEISLEGFDWGLEGSSWSSHYCVAGRGFGVLNPAAAKKFTNYAEIVVARGNRPVRKSHFLFILPFQRLHEWDSVSAEFNRFFSADNHAKISNIPVAIAVIDARQGRTMRFGQLREKRLEEVLQSVATAG